MPSGTYSYRITAVNDNGQSAPSNEVSAEIADRNDVDTDGDGVPDDEDGCPDDAGKSAPGTCGCGMSDADGDEDGTPECNDQCTQDPDKIDSGLCGCGVPESDQCSTKPIVPALMMPMDATTDTDLFPSLETSEFQDPDNGDTYAQTVWQISKNDDFGELLYKETSDERLTAFPVPQSLDAETTYYWRACHIDSHGAQSEWPDAFSFTTGIQDQAPDSNPDDNGGSGSGRSSGCFIGAVGF